jgi:serine/threonine protein kinase
LSGTVVKAIQTRLGRPVAIKFFDGFGSRKNSALRKRFEREAVLLARIQHPAVPYVLTTGVIPDVDVPYTVIQFIEGHRLRDELDKKRALDPDIALRFTAETLDALRAAHRERIIHRDVKPENIMLSNGHCVLIDFSIGFSMEDAPGATRATATGEGLGTLDYMCPEQRRDMGRVDERCDLYAMGIVLLEMLAGTPRLAPERIDTHLAHIPPGVRSVVKRASAEQAEARYQSAEEFLDALRPLISARPTLLNVETRALCANTLCPGANWSPRGYYRGPQIHDQTKANHCGSCGQPLKRHCDHCGAGYADARFCGDCGAEWYKLPECATCGSWLRRADMGTDTAKNCCTKGREKAEHAARRAALRPSTGYGRRGTNNDDIPF